MADATNFTFPIKLRAALNEPTISYIRWNNAKDPKIIGDPGTTVILDNAHKEDICSTLSKSRVYDSVLKQFNNYGFLMRSSTKNRHNASHLYFINPLFKKDNNFIPKYRHPVKTKKSKAKDKIPKSHKCMITIKKDCYKRFNIRLSLALEDPKIPFIRWNDEGVVVVVDTDYKKEICEYLSSGDHTPMYSSIVRVLKSYGFKLLSYNDGDPKNEYHYFNPFFSKREMSLLNTAIRSEYLKEELEYDNAIFKSEPIIVDPGTRFDLERHCCVEIQSWFDDELKKMGLTLCS